MTSLVIDNTMGNSSAISITGDTAQINSWSLQSVMRVILLEKYTAINEQLAEMGDAMAATNADIKTAADIIAQFKKWKGEKTESPAMSTSVGNTTMSNFLIKYDTYYNKIKTGLSDDGDENGLQWDANISYVQGLLDKLNSQASQQSTQLQNLNNKMTNAGDLLNSTNDELHKNRESILSNM